MPGPAATWGSNGPKTFHRFVVFTLVTGWTMSCPIASRLVSRAEAQDSRVEDRSTAASTEGDASATPPLGELPWREGRPVEPNAPAPPQSNSPRKMLSLMGIEQSQLEAFFDNTPLTSDTDEILARILFRLPQFSRDNVHRWAHRDLRPQQLAASADRYRGEFVRLEGFATHVEKASILPEIASRYEFKDYYRVTMEVSDSPHEAVIATREIPTEWAVGESIRQRASVEGLFLKTGATPEDGEAANLVLAARRVAWHPDQPQPELGIRNSHVLLADAGMDIGLLAPLKKRNRTGMNGSDRESFYQMLDAMQRLQMSQLETARSFNLSAMLTKPETLHGNLYQADMVARRITRIVVNDADVQSRFGIDHYYQVDCFVPLGDTIVRLGKKDDDQEDPVFTNHYPVTFCTLQLPPDLKTISDKFYAGKLPTESLNERVRVVGFFWKLWSYRSEYISQFDKKKQQWAPMLVGIRPEIVEPAATSPWWGVAGGTGFLVILAIIWVGVYRYSRGDEKFEDTVIKRNFEVPAGKSLDDMGLDASSEPDFSNLKQKDPKDQKD